MSACLRSAGRDVFPAVSADDGRLNFLLQLDLGLLVGVRELHQIERVTLLLEHEIGSRGARRRHRDDAVDLLLARRCDQRHRAAFAVAADDDFPLVDVLALREPLHRRHHIVRVVGERRGFGPSAALADSALVVAEDNEAVVGERLGQLREDGNADNRFVTVRRARSSNQDDRGRAKAVGNRGAALSACRRD